MATRIDSLTVDVTLSEKHGGRVSLTVHPIEKGMNPTDHARLEPAKYSLEGIFANFPLPVPSNRAAGLDRASNDSYAKKQSDRLWALLANRNAITVVTELKTYKNMVLTSLDMPRDPAIGQDVQFSASFDEVRFVNVELVALTVPKTSVPEQPTGKTKQSKQVPTDASSADSSAALNIYNFLSGGN